MFLSEKFAMYEEQGEKRGEIKGEAKLAELMQKLFSLNRTEDAIRASSDLEFRSQLYKEFAM